MRQCCMIIISTIKSTMRTNASNFAILHCRYQNDSRAISDNLIHSAQKTDPAIFSDFARDCSFPLLSSRGLSLSLSLFLSAIAITRSLSIFPRNFVCREILFPVVRRDRNAKCSSPSLFLAPYRYFRFAQALCSCIRDSSPRYGFTVASRRNERAFKLAMLAGFSLFYY